MTTSNWATDNRYGPNNSGATAPLDSPAAYSARWIDKGDDSPADVLPDRQGFAYDDEADRDRLIEQMNLHDLRTLKVSRDESRCVVNQPDVQVVQRRSGGYIYVDAWLVPPIDNPPAADVRPFKQYLVTVFEPGNITDDPRNIHTILTSTDNIQPRERVVVERYDG